MKRFGLHAATTLLGCLCCSADAKPADRGKRHAERLTARPAQDQRIAGQAGIDARPTQPRRGQALMPDRAEAGRVGHRSIVLPSPGTHVQLPPGLVVQVAHLRHPGFGGLHGLFDDRPSPGPSR